MEENNNMLTEIREVITKNYEKKLEKLQQEIDACERVMILSDNIDDIQAACHNRDGFMEAADNLTKDYERLVMSYSCQLSRFCREIDGKITSGIIEGRSEAFVSLNLKSSE